jgi:UDP-N-acetyl-D-mannosaminuronic acid dehydrogenase
LGISLARSGKRVMLYDIDEKAIHTVSQGKMPFMEAGQKIALSLS